MDYNQVQIDQGRQGMVATPTFNEVTGEYGDFQVSGNGVLENEYKFQDFQQNNDTVNPEAFEPQDDIDDQLVDAFTEVNPDLFQAISYARQFWSEEQIQDWNNRVDNNGWFDIAEDLEQILQQYREAGSPDIEPNVYEEEPEITQQDVDAEYQALIEAEPEGLELAGDHLNAAQQYYEQGDALSAQILMASSQFHSGAMTAEQAIESVLNSGYSQEQIIDTYYNLFDE